MSKNTTDEKPTTKGREAVEVPEVSMEVAMAAAESLLNGTTDDVDDGAYTDTESTLDLLKSILKKNEAVQDAAYEAVLTTKDAITKLEEAAGEEAGEEDDAVAVVKDDEGEGEGTLEENEKVMKFDLVGKGGTYDLNITQGLTNSGSVNIITVPSMYWNEYKSLIPNGELQALLGNLISYHKDHKVGIQILPPGQASGSLPLGIDETTAYVWNEFTWPLLNPGVEFDPAAVDLPFSAINHEYTVEEAGEGLHALIMYTSDDGGYELDLTNIRFSVYDTAIFIENLLTDAKALEVAPSIENLKVIESSAGKDDKRKFTITFTPLQDIVMGGKAGPDEQGDQILITGLNNDGTNLPSRPSGLNIGEIWTDYDPKNATIVDGGGWSDNIVAGNFRFQQEGWRIWWKGDAVNSDHAYYIEIDLNREDTITLNKNMELQIEFTIDAPWPNPGSKPPYNNYQNKTGNKIGVQIYSKNTDARPTATKAPLAVETTLGTYFKGRAPNPDNPYPTVGEEAAAGEEDDVVVKDDEGEGEGALEENEKVMEFDLVDEVGAYYLNITQGLTNIGSVNIITVPSVYWKEYESLIYAAGGLQGLLGNLMTNYRKHKVGIQILSQGQESGSLPLGIDKTTANIWNEFTWPLVRPGFEFDPYAVDLPFGAIDHEYTVEEAVSGLHALIMYTSDDGGYELDLTNIRFSVYDTPIVIEDLLTDAKAAEPANNLTLPRVLQTYTTQNGKNITGLEEWSAFRDTTPATVPQNILTIYRDNFGDTSASECYIYNAFADGTEDPSVGRIVGYANSEEISFQIVSEVGNVRLKIDGLEMTGGHKYWDIKINDKVIDSPVDNTEGAISHWWEDGRTDEWGPGAPEIIYLEQGINLVSVRLLNSTGVSAGLGYLTLVIDESDKEVLGARPAEAAQAGTTKEPAALDPRITITYDTTSNTVSVGFLNATSSTDWIGIYQNQDTPGEVASKKFQYLNGSGSSAPPSLIENGSLTFDVSDLDAGSYIVYFMKDDWYTPHTSSPLTLPLAQEKKRGQTASKTDEIMAELESLLAKLKELHEKI